jgi:hypothetical protein
VTLGQLQDLVSRLDVIEATEPESKHHTNRPVRTYWRCFVPEAFASDVDFSLSLGPVVQTCSSFFQPHGT